MNIHSDYTLDDWWPPSGAMMWPGTFENINDGTRDRLGLFGEWESRLNTQWLTLLGARYERVKTDAGNVRGYDPNTNGMGMMVNDQKKDAAAFNVQDRERTDNNWDLTALARYTPDANSDIEFGVALKVRSPNLYERYTWSTWSMAAVKNNLVGDGNGYFGKLGIHFTHITAESKNIDRKTPTNDGKIDPIHQSSHLGLPLMVANFHSDVASQNYVRNWDTHYRII